MWFLISNIYTTIIYFNVYMDFYFNVDEEVVHEEAFVTTKVAA